MAAGSSIAGSDALQEAVQGEHRSEEHRARDKYRHPVETLNFFDVQPSHTVVELWPGGGWYSEILAPLLREQGQFIAASFDPDLPPAYRGRIEGEFRAKLATSPEVYSEVEVVPFAFPDGLANIPPNSVDRVLSFRSSHNWMREAAMKAVYQAAFDMLKPGGVFGVVQHRANEDTPALWARKYGYMPQSHVIAVAESVGFVLESTSEINANPRDTKDHSEGVWTLPPSYRLGDVDREKYAAIGESDRMTLKFKKPE